MSMTSPVYTPVTFTGSASWSWPFSTASINSAMQCPATGAFLNWFPLEPMAT